MLSNVSVALIGSPRNEVELVPRNGIFSREMCRPGLVVRPVWPLMDVAAHFDTLAFRSDHSSHFSVVSNITWQSSLLLAVRHVHTHTHTHTHHHHHHEVSAAA